MKFLQNASTPILQFKLTLIYILNVLDILFTTSLLKTGYFLESNPLMATIMQSCPLTIILKLIFPALLIIYVIRNLEALPLTNLKLSNYMINALLMLYLFILISHLVYTTFFIYTTVFI